MSTNILFLILLGWITLFGIIYFRYQPHINLDNFCSEIFDNMKVSKNILIKDFEIDYKNNTKNINFLYRLDPETKEYIKDNYKFYIITCHKKTKTYICYSGILFYFFN